MEAAGLREVYLKSLEAEGDGRLWRSVPGRRWYSEQRGETPGSREVVLFHVKNDAEVKTALPSGTASLNLVIDRDRFVTSGRRFRRRISAGHGHVVHVESATPHALQIFFEECDRIWRPDTPHPLQAPSDALR